VVIRFSKEKTVLLQQGGSSEAQIEITTISVMIIPPKGGTVNERETVGYAD
jgi:hypothetical protein